MHLRIATRKLLVLFLLLFLAGAAQGQAPSAPATLRPAAAPSAGAASGTRDSGAVQGIDMKLLEEALKKIQQTYVQPEAIQSKALTYGALSGIVNALGDTGHSRFLTPEMARQQRNVARGEFEGIGAELRVKDNQVVIAAPIDGSPAQRAGLKPGDVISKVNGQGVSGIPLDQVIARILGPRGTEVTLTVFRPGTKVTTDVTLVREKIAMRAVSWSPIPGTRVAHLRIARFSRGVNRELEKALAEIEAARMTGLVLDLRNNPGGLLGEAVATVSQFLSEGYAVLERDGRGKITPVPVRKGGKALGIPMVVLINNHTASGAEIVAGALKDYGRSKVVGERTFGTGTILRSIDLSDGSALLLAFKEWLTPLGHSIWHRGIEPDIAAALPVEVAPVLPAMEKEWSREALQRSGDTQLLRALGVLEPGVPTPLEKTGAQTAAPVVPPLN